jgi:hypothetical protein
MIGAENATTVLSKDPYSPSPGREQQKKRSVFRLFLRSLNNAATVTTTGILGKAQM